MSEGARLHIKTHRLITSFAPRSKASLDKTAQLAAAFEGMALRIRVN